ncbi:MAG: hypothetical protein ABSC56_09565 [Solirubrobacteraceae bacterium]|jgi:hypothetical protein
MRVTTCGALAAPLFAGLALAGAANAAVAGTQTFDQTYPVASALCAKAPAGTLPKRLEENKAAVITACNTLQDAFGPLQSAVTSAEQQYSSTVASEQAKVHAVCPPTTAAGRPACRSARQAALAADGAARSTRRAAVLTYHGSVETNREAFWTTISNLRSSTS